MPRDKTSEVLELSLLAVTQTAVGCAVGLLLAGKLGRPAQKTTAVMLLGIGTLLAMPLIFQFVSAAVAGPGSARGERRRLDSIRTDSGFPSEADIF